MKPSNPKFNLLEHVAAELAGVTYDAMRSSGLKSEKWKTARQYAAANLEKFIPYATKHLIAQLGRPDVSVDQKEEIYECLMERINDPMAQSLVQESEGHALPDIDISRIIPIQELPAVIKDQRVRAKRH